MGNDWQWKLREGGKVEDESDLLDSVINSISVLQLESLKNAYFGSTLFLSQVFPTQHIFCSAAFTLKNNKVGNFLLAYISLRRGWYSKMTGEVFQRNSNSELVEWELSVPHHHKKRTMMFQFVILNFIHLFSLCPFV